MPEFVPVTHKKGGVAIRARWDLQLPPLKKPRILDGQQASHSLDLPLVGTVRLCVCLIDDAIGGFHLYVSQPAHDVLSVSFHSATKLEPR